MARACVLLAEGFEEIEAVTVLDVLRRAGVQVQAVSLRGKRVTGSHGITLVADTTLREAARQQWDAVILPGGLPGAENLRDDPAVRDLVRKHFENGSRVAAICAGPIALAAAGVLDGRRATCYPGFEAQLGAARCASDRVVVDGNVVTSRGPGTAIEFALALVAELVDREAEAGLRQRMLVGT
jgi:4-methyl-5(b-hydroxyethyl)-thiazole monophosphate biosynthesis